MCASQQFIEMEKRRQYDERVREVERGSFTPLVFSTSGGMGRQATVFFKRLASLLARKRDQPYSHVIGWIRCRLGFSLLRSSITSLRGTRSIAGFVPSPTYPVALDLTISEGQVPLYIMSNETHFDIVLDFILDLANHIHSLTIYLQLTIYLTRLLLYSKHVRQCARVLLYLLFQVREKIKN